MSGYKSAAWRACAETRELGNPAVPRARLMKPLDFLQWRHALGTLQDVLSLPKADYPVY